MNIDTIGPQISTKENFNSLNGLQTNPPMPISMKDDIMEEENLSSHPSENSLGNKMLNGNMNGMSNGFNNGFMGNQGSFQNNNFSNNNFFNNNPNSIFGSVGMDSSVQTSTLLNKSRQLHSLPLKVSEEEPTKFQQVRQNQQQPAQMENELFGQKQDSSCMEDLPNTNENLMADQPRIRNPFEGRNESLVQQNPSMNLEKAPMEESLGDDSTRILLGEISNRGNFQEMEMNEPNLKVVTNLHNRLIDEILLQEDELIKRHEVSIDQDVQNIKKEMESVEEVKREASSLTDYLDQMEKILAEKVAKITSFQMKIGGLKSLLSEETNMNAKISGFKNRVEGIFDLKDNDNDIFNLDEFNNDMIN